MPGTASFLISTCSPTTSSRRWLVFLLLLLGFAHAQPEAAHTTHHSGGVYCGGRYCRPGETCEWRGYYSTCIDRCSAMYCPPPAVCETRGGRTGCYDPPTPVVVTCATVRCGYGQVCEIQNGRPVCVVEPPPPPPPTLTCANVLCRPGFTCRMRNGQPHCEPNPPTPTTCATIDCPPGTTCRMQAGFPRCIEQTARPPTCAWSRECRRYNHDWGACSAQSCCRWRGHSCVASRHCCRRGHGGGGEGGGGGGGGSGQLVCPTPFGAGICVELCPLNGCPAGQLCCSNGCGHVCMNGVPA